MRAHSKRKHEMGKRFALVIGVAAAGVMALGAQTATSTMGSVDRVPPDLELSGPTKQTLPAPGSCDVPCTVDVNFRCDEKCTTRGKIPRAKGRLTGVEHAKLKQLKQAGGFIQQPTVGPGVCERAPNFPGCPRKPGRAGGLFLFVPKQTRLEAGAALAAGKNVEAKVTVRARDAAGNVATAKRTITLVK
jgi:hypothetical protein